MASAGQPVNNDQSQTSLWDLLVESKRRHDKSTIHKAEPVSAPLLIDGLPLDELPNPSYTAPALCPGGVKLSSAALRSLASLIAPIYGGEYRTHSILHPSAEGREAFRLDGGSDSYGELMPEALLDLLWHVGAQPGDRFYDLGSGTGKLVAVAWLLGLRATGIELCVERAQVAAEAMRRFKELSDQGLLSAGGSECSSGLPARAFGMDCISGSLYNLDFTDADIVFVNSVLFSRAAMSKFAQQARWMKPGAKIICFHDIADLGYMAVFPEFECLGQCDLAVSWTERTQWSVFRLLTAPSEGEPPADLRRAEEFDAAARSLFSI